MRDLAENVWFDVRMLIVGGTLMCIEKLVAYILAQCACMFCKTHKHNTQKGVCSWSAGSQLVMHGSLQMLRRRNFWSSCKKVSDMSGNVSPKCRWTQRCRVQIVRV